VLDRSHLTWWHLDHWKIHFEYVFIAFNRWSITLNILAPTRDISSITTSYNCSYQHVSLFKESDDKFYRFADVYWTSMFNGECIVWPWILNATLSIDAINNALIFVKVDDRSLLYSHNKPWIISFKVKILLVLAPPICIGILKYIYFLYMISLNINLCSLFNYLNIFWYCDSSIIIKFDDLVKPSSSKFCVLRCNVLHDWMMKSFFKSYFSIFNVFVMGITRRVSPMSSSMSSFHMFCRCEEFNYKFITSYFSFVCLFCML